MSAEIAVLPGWEDVHMVTAPPASPDCEPHTPDPASYTLRAEWFEAMADAGYAQRQCKGCGLWLVWERRDRITTEEAAR